MTHNEIERLLKRMNGTLEEIKHMLVLNLKLEITNMATLDELLAEVERDTTVTAGIATMIEKLQADLAAQGVDQAKIDAVFAGVKANTDALAAKLVANTPSAPPPAA
jgi:cell division FtsZ-interacting protein ZapD